VIPTRAGAVLDMLGIPQDARNYADLGDTGWYDALVAADHRIAKPEPMFPRLELATEAA
jgi:methionyl-tRNA synthetase